jgi:uncharacterized protein (TIGR02145 family)
MNETVNIGTQVWSTKNLDISTFRNGNAIIEAKTDQEWEVAGKLGMPAWCYYNNDPANGTKYGKLYNWHAVNDPRGLAPEGFHIPSDAEWKTLIKEYLGTSIAGKKMKSAEGWDENGNGSNETGFSGLPGGSRDYNGPFANIRILGVWWSTTEDDAGNVFIRALRFDSESSIKNYGYKDDGFSVRCIKD